MESTGDKDSDLERLREEVGHLIAQKLSTDNYYMLSKLGQDLDPTLVSKIRSVAGKKLTEFVSSEFHGRYNVVPISVLGKNSIAVVNAGSTVDSLELPKAEGNLGKERFNRRFWAAFSVPMKAAHRLLDLESLLFLDTNNYEGSASAGRREVLLEDVAPTDIDERDGVIKSNINRWLIREGLDRNRFIIGHAKREVLHQEANMPLSLLENIVQSLDRSQLQRVSLPLDVVAILAKRFV